MLIEKSYLDLAMPETLENSLIESEMMSLSVKISRLLCIGAGLMRKFYFGHRQMKQHTSSSWDGAKDSSSERCALSPC